MRPRTTTLRGSNIFITVDHLPSARADYARATPSSWLTCRRGEHKVQVMDTEVGLLTAQTVTLTSPE